MKTSRPHSPRLASPDLFAACRQGDARAWDRLLHRSSPSVYRWAVMLGLDASEAEDAAQEVLTTAYQRFDRCRGADVLEAWLYQITRRIVANRRRRVWWRRVVPQAPTAPAFAHATRAEVEHELTVRACLSRLSPAHAEVLLLADLEAHTRDEIAHILKLRPGTVASRLRRARAAFKALWNEQAPQMPAPHFSPEAS